MGQLLVDVPVQPELIPGPIRKNLGCRPWDQYARGYKSQD
jgi:hypothetical protein